MTSVGQNPVHVPSGGSVKLVIQGLMAAVDTLGKKAASFGGLEPHCTSQDKQQQLEHIGTLSAGPAPTRQCGCVQRKQELTQLLVTGTGVAGLSFLIFQHRKDALHLQSAVMLFSYMSMPVIDQVVKLEPRTSNAVLTPLIRLPLICQFLF